MSRDHNIRSKLLQAFDPSHPCKNDISPQGNEAACQKLPPQRNRYSINRQSYLNSPEEAVKQLTPQKQAESSKTKHSSSQNKKKFLKIVSQSQERIPRSLVTSRMQQHTTQLRQSRRSLRETSQKLVPYEDSRSKTITRTNSCILSTYDGEFKCTPQMAMPVKERVIVTQKIVPVFIKNPDLKVQQPQNRQFHPHLQSKYSQHAPTMQQFDIKQQIITEVGRRNNFMRPAHNPSFIQASQQVFQPNMPMESQKVTFLYQNPPAFGLPVHPANPQPAYHPQNQMIATKPCSPIVSGTQTPIRMINNSPEPTPRAASVLSSRSMHQIPPYSQNTNPKLMVVQNNQPHARQLSLTNIRDQGAMKCPPTGAVPAFRTVTTRQLPPQPQNCNNSQQMVRPSNDLAHSFCPNQQSNPSPQQFSQVKFSYSASNSSDHKIEQQKVEESNLLRSISQQITENDKKRREVEERIEKKLNEISERTHSLKKDHEVGRNTHGQRQSLTSHQQPRPLTLINRQAQNKQKQKLVAKYEQIIGKENEKHGHLVQKARGQGIARVF